MSVQPVQFPAELQSARSDVLEVGTSEICTPPAAIHAGGSLQEYVQSRIAQLISVFSRRLQHHVPGLPSELITKSLTEAFSQVPPPEYSIIPLEDRDLQLVFRHDCM